MENKEGRSPLDVILSHMNYYGTYHHHKDQLIFTAVSLYLTGVAALSFLDHQTINNFGCKGLLILLIIISGLTGIFFIFWQYRKREEAASIVGVCLNLSTKWLSEEPSEADLKPEFFQSYFWPKILVDELRTYLENYRFKSEIRFPEILIYIVLVIWTVIAIIHINLI